MACGVLGVGGHFCLCGAKTHIFDEGDKLHPSGLGSAEWGLGAGCQVQGLALDCSAEILPSSSLQVCGSFF